MNKLYKYRCFNKFTDKIILNSSLYFPTVNEINDPFDCKLSFKQKYSSQEITNHFKQMANNSPHKFTLEELQKSYPDEKSFTDMKNKVTQQLIDKIGVLSLSTSPKNILMWSHYSNKHTGLVFQFTFEENSNCFHNPLLVDYKDKYDLLSYTSDFTKETPKLMLTKHNDWAYESEVRVIDLGFQGEKKFKTHELTSIIFGALAKDEDIDGMIKLCRNNGFSHVKFSQAGLIPGEFSLNFREILNTLDAKP